MRVIKAHAVEASDFTLLASALFSLAKELYSRAGSDLGAREFMAVQVDLLHGYTKDTLRRAERELRGIRSYLPAVSDAAGAGMSKLGRVAERLGLSGSTVAIVDEIQRKADDTAFSDTVIGTP